MSNLIDIGHGHAIQFVSFDGDEHAAINDYLHRKDGTPCSGFIPFAGHKWEEAFPQSAIEVWDVQSLDPLTITPSVLCRTCGDHGHITNGKWVPA